MEKITRSVALSTAIDFLSAQEGMSETVEVLTKMREVLARKASKPTSHKPTANQLENDAIRDEILSLLTDGAMSIPQLMDGITVETAKELTSQRISALLTQLKREGAVVRNEGKTATFSLCESADEADLADEEA